jgi:hypothetical protein
MFYRIRKKDSTDLYLADGGHYVSYSVIGDPDTPATWVKGRDNGLGTWSRDQAGRLADRYGGEVEEIYELSSW